MFWCLIFASLVRGTTQNVGCGCYLHPKWCKRVQPIHDVALHCHAAFPSDLQETMASGQYYAVYAGDSIMRGTFASLLLYLAAASVSWPEVLSFNLAWYHSDQYFCCASLDSTPTCEWGRQGLEFNTTAHEAASRGFERGARFCAIFVWSPSQPAVDLLQLGNNTTMRPDLIVVNPGLHHLKYGADTNKDVVREVVESTFAFLDANLLQHEGRPPPRFFFQETTSLLDSVIQKKHPSYAERFNNARILQYNSYLRQEVSRVQCKRKFAGRLAGPSVKSGYIRAYSMSVNAPREQRKADGVHFNREFYTKLNLLYFQLAFRGGDVC